MKRVAIEQSLQQVSDFLASKGYEVTNLDGENNQYDAAVISGQDKDVLGMQEATNQAPVINAQGLTAEEVYQQLSNHFQA